MPARRGPGRPPEVGRPRAIENDYLRVTRGHLRPSTIKRQLWDLRTYQNFLRQTRVDSEAVTIHTIVAFQAWLESQRGGYTTGLDHKNSSVRSYYKWKGSAEPDSKWSLLAQQISVLRKPEIIGEVHPHEAFPLEVLPKILEAARHTIQVDKASRNVYSEAFVLTATFLYTGGRAQFYGLKDSQVREALETKFLRTWVKGGKKQVKVPIHDRLLEIWRRHFEERDFDGPMFFRNGRDPYTYHEGNKDWHEDQKAGGANISNVERILRGGSLVYANRMADGVESELERLYGVKETITSHRFRKSVVTYMELYGFTSAERRLQVSHGAETITEAYSDPKILEVQRKISEMDLGSAEWVAQHTPPSNLFAGNANGSVDQDLVAQLRSQLQDERARSDRLEKKLDELLARSEPKVIA